MIRILIGFDIENYYSVVGNKITERIHKEFILGITFSQVLQAPICRKYIHTRFSN